VADGLGVERVAAATSKASGDATGTVEPSAAARPVSAADARAARKELQRIERRLGQLDRSETGLHARMVVVAEDYVALGALEVELRAVHDERATLEERWLEVADED
jgi:ATP-binding cassette subfamily F protein uup